MGVRFGNAIMLYIFAVIDVAKKVLPEENLIFQEHIGVFAAGFGNGYRAGVNVSVPLAKGLPGGDVGMAVEENIPGLQGWQELQVEIMAMGGVNQPAPHRQNAIVRQNGKLQPHLVHFRIAVTPNTEYLTFKGIK